MAVANYHAANGCYPPAYVTDDDGKPIHSWRVLLLPYLEEQELFDQYDFRQPWNSQQNLRLEAEMPEVYAFHGEYEPGVITTNYLAVVGGTTAWPGASCRTSEEVTDEHAATILLVENMGQNVHWMEPRDLHFDTISSRINDPSGISSKYLDPAVVMLDGSLRRLDNEIPPRVLRAMLTANGGEPLSSIGETWRLLPDGRLRQQPEATRQRTAAATNED